MKVMPHRNLSRFRSAAFTLLVFPLGCSSGEGDVAPFEEAASEGSSDEDGPSMSASDDPVSEGNGASPEPEGAESTPERDVEGVDPDTGDLEPVLPNSDEVVPDPDPVLPNPEGEPEPQVDPEASDPAADPEMVEPEDPGLGDPPAAAPADTTPADDADPQGGQSGGDDGREPGCIEVRRTLIEDASVPQAGASLPLVEVVDGVVGVWPADVYQNLPQPVDGKTRELLGPGTLTFTAVDSPAYVIEFEPEEFTLPPGSDAAGSDAAGDGAATAPPSCLPVYSFELELHAEYADLFDTTMRARFTTTTSDLGAAPRFSGAVALDEAGGTIWPTEFDPADFWAARLELSGEVIVGDGLIAHFEEQGYRPDYAALELVAYQEPFADCEGSACDGIANRTEYPIRMTLGEKLSATR